VFFAGREEPSHFRGYGGAGVAARQLGIGREEKAAKGGGVDDAVDSGGDGPSATIQPR
jgi:hypothetical protein